MSAEMFISPRDLALWPDLPLVLVHAAQAGKTPTVGEFLLSLSEEQVDQVLLYARQAQQGGAALMGLNLFSVMLANAEAMPVPMETDLSLLSRRLILMLQAHMLHLQGLMVLAHHQLTLEHFDIRKVPLAPGARGRFDGVRVVEVPRPSSRNDG